MRAEFRVENHLTEERVLRLLDGELDKRQKEVVMRHLESCWACRRKREQFQEAMGRFVEFEEALTNTVVVPPPNGWSGFRLRLREVSGGAAGRRERAWAGALRVGALAPIFVAVTALVALWLTPARSVSAKEIIEQSASSEQALL